MWVAGGRVNDGGWLQVKGSRLRRGNFKLGFDKRQGTKSENPQPQQVLARES